MKLPVRIHGRIVVFLVALGAASATTTQLTRAANTDAAATLARDPKTEELQNGRWITVDQKSPTTQPTTDAALTRVEDLIEAGEYSRAFKRDVEWLQANPGHPLRDRGLMLAAHALYRYGDRVKAFFYLDELLDEYPDSRYFYPALEKQFDIADGFLNGYKSRFLGLPILSREDEGIEMLYRVQQRSPGSALADRALLRTADYYFSDKQYDLAVDAYGAYIKSYPRSPVIPQVKLRQAYSNLNLYRGPRFDATPFIDGRAQLTELIATQPQIARDYQLQDKVATIDHDFAKKLLFTADFYRRTNQPRGAVYTYRFLINAYPESAEAKQAQQALARFPQSALEDKPPGGGTIGVPSTQPTASASARD